MVHYYIVSNNKPPERNEENLLIPPRCSVHKHLHILYNTTLRLLRFPSYMAWVDAENVQPLGKSTLLRSHFIWCKFFVFYVVLVSHEKPTIWKICQINGFLLKRKLIFFHSGIWIQTVCSTVCLFVSFKDGFLLLSIMLS